MTESGTIALIKRLLAPPGSDFTLSTAWVRLGMRSMLVFVIGLFGFGMLFSINGAVVTGGMVTFESSYKTVQHLDGGIVSKLLVRNGDRVRAGDELVELDDTAARANLAVVESRITDFFIQQVRLEAERDRRNAFALPRNLLKGPMTTDTARVLAAQQAVFDARLQSRLGERSVLGQRVEQLNSERAGLRSQLDARQRERKLNATELASVRSLFDKGFANQQRMTTLEKEAARLDGEIGRLKNDVARSAGGIAEAELKQAQSEKTFTESVVDDLRKVQTQLSELDENRKTLSDKVARSTIRSPSTGRVHALAIQTIGGVITPATPIMQIIPEGERLIVEARVMPQDIDKVRSGQEASLRFPAFDARATPRIDGKVSLVSAAQLTDPQGKSYFTAQIEIAAAEIAKIGAGHVLLPGMPAEVYIQTKARSIMSYFLKPLTDAMFHIFRER